MARRPHDHARRGARRLRLRLTGVARDQRQRVLGVARTVEARAADGTRRGTRPRTWLLATASFGALGVMFGAVSQSALAVNFTSASSSYRVYTDRVAGADAAAFVGAQPVSGVNGGRATLQLGIGTASLSGLCAVAQQTLPVIGTVSLVVTAGEPVDGTVTGPSGQTITAAQAYLATELLSGRGDAVEKITLGQSADTLTMGSTPFAGAVGGFGLQIRTLNIADLDATTYGIDLQGQVNLPNLRVRVVPGTATKASCAS